MTDRCLSTNEDFFPRSRRTIKITKRLRPVFRGLFFESDTCPPPEDLSASGGTRLEKGPFMDRH
jgi:hypothetical protein